MRGFGQSVPATLSMSAPFIGYAILYHSEIASWLGGLGGFLDKTPQCQSCPQFITFQMKLSFLYCGVVLLGIGTILYRIFAPEEVKERESASKFVVENVDIATARRLRSMFATIKSRRPEATHSLISRAQWLERDRSLKTASDALKRDDNNSIKIDVLSSYYNVLDRHTLRSLVVIITILYVLGFSLLSVPGIIFTLRVICTILYEAGIYTNSAECW